MLDSAVLYTSQSPTDGQFRQMSPVLIHLAGQLLLLLTDSIAMELVRTPETGRDAALQHLLV
jgi:hypothetical protein